MQIRYNVEKLGRMLNDLSVLTGISIAFLDRDYQRICGSITENDFCERIQTNPELMDKCLCSDLKILKKCGETKCFESHICYAGLYDASLPIVVNGIVAGYVIMGRVRSDDSPKKSVYIEDTALSNLYKEIPFFTTRQLNSLRTLLPSILFADAINFELDELAEQIADYIKSNLTADLSINSLGRRFFISKNRLYECFKACYSTTVNEYIISARIEKAKELLLETKEPVFTICEKSGIDNYTYFCKLFKKREKMTPIEFRKKGNYSK